MRKLTLNEYVFECEECGKLCEPVEDSWDYAGTHCTGGNAGTHRTGDWYSDCCDAGYSESSAGCSDQD